MLIFRKTRTFVDATEATMDEIVEAIPDVMPSTEFKSSEKETMHAVLLCIIMMTDIRRDLVKMKGENYFIQFFSKKNHSKAYR